MCRRGHIRSDAPRTELFRQTAFTNIYTICTVRQILVARTLLLVRRHREEQQLGAAIADVPTGNLNSLSYCTGRGGGG
jgi:hypothetical protein